MELKKLRARLTCGPRSGGAEAFSGLVQRHDDLPCASPIHAGPAALIVEVTRPAVGIMDA